jgi:hypothetical protein
VAVTVVSIWSRSTASSGSAFAGSVQAWNFSTIQASCATGESFSATPIVEGWLAWRVR